MELGEKRRGQGRLWPYSFQFLNPKSVSSQITVILFGSESAVIWDTWLTIEENENIVTTGRNPAKFLGAIGLGLSGLIAVALGRPGNFAMAQTKYLTDYRGEILINISQKSYDQIYRIYNPDFQFGIAEETF